VPELPAGTVTFLFSDIEGSTRLVQRLGDRWAEVLGDHNRIMREAFSAMGGAEVDRQGDAFFAVFARARHAIAAAAEAQRELAAHEWPEGVDLRVRMGLHTGEPGVGDEGYLGLDVVRAARICSAAHGGQVVLSETTAALIRGDRLEGLELRDLGEHRLKDLEQAERLYELLVPGLPASFPPLRTAAAAAPGVPALAGQPSADWEAYSADLTRQALEAVRGLDPGPLATLGPRIEQHVEASLRAASVPVADRRGPRGPKQLPVSTSGALVLGVLALVIVILVVVALIVLVAKLL
jgi:class 3 adenylate cyclase